MTTATPFDLKKNKAQQPMVSPAQEESETHSAPVAGLVVGVLVSICGEGLCSVSFNGNPGGTAVRAKVLAAITEDDIGKTVALLFENGEIKQPVVMGLLRSSAQGNCNLAKTVSGLVGPALQIQSDDDEINLIANRKLVLKCGSASITLDIDGNVEIRGNHILSRAAGQNRIKGSAISLN
ncbi:DUF6484 domain-containing protein [Massilia genomosp. 1]|uniref:DUF6484 domain-containing protein n=1 Tax=Massilia genomosp. 1 TaxID=2609280 RepID=A0ABX0N577_9BURK|nr:DUF6484 domain-containing protein [Massilia genomosp. 1]NHZ66679.1 hypothetical protein [Massilia genomosp. 1]